MPGGDDPTAPVSPEAIARMLADAPTASAVPVDVAFPGPTLAPDTRLRGRYRIVRFIARGGMGEVYEAQDTALHTRVALKTVRAHIADDPLTLTRFRREIQTARTVTHPNVCRVFDLDHADVAGRPLAFYTMEFLAGETLAARLRRGPPAHAEARRILDDITAGIAAAHAAGVIHRDLKPANVMLLDKHGRAVITDFGLALPAGTMVGAAAPAGSSADGTTIAGTPAYMAPELTAGAPPSVATDLYALGVCMFELRPPRARRTAILAGAGAAIALGAYALASRGGARTPVIVAAPNVAIGDDGAVIVAAIEWRGELHAAEVTVR